MLGSIGNCETVTVLSSTRFIALKTRHTVVWLSQWDPKNIEYNLFTRLR